MGLLHVVVAAVIAIAAYWYFSKRQGCDLLKSLGLGCPAAAQKADQADKPAEKPASVAEEAPTQRTDLTDVSSARTAVAPSSTRTAAAPASSRTAVAPIVAEDAAPAAPGAPAAAAPSNGAAAELSGGQGKTSAYINVKMEAQANASQQPAAAPTAGLPAKENSNNSTYAAAPEATADEPTSKASANTKSKSKKSKPSRKSTSKKSTKIN